jgi:YD repeat-containing protein
MTRTHFSHPALIRVVCLLLCYALIAPFSALTPRPTAVNASIIIPREPAKTENSPHETAQTAQRARWREGELLVRFRQNVSAREIDALLQANGVQRNGQIRGQSGIERLRLSIGFDPATVAAALRASRLVDLAEPNYLITADEVTPNDPRFSEQWGLKNTGSVGGQLGSDINVAQAWRVTTGTRRTVIAVIDSGIDFSHPDLRNNQWNNLLEQANSQDDDENDFTDDLHGWDFVTDKNEIKDEQGHGTAVAGVIAARGNNSVGISGVMWRASLLSLRVLDSTGTGDVAGAVEAIDYATQNGAQVVHCSWGTDDASVALREAISRASRRGVVVVASAGNGGHDIETQPHYPASYNSDNLIAVASTDNSDLLASFSNWGANHVTIAAPGKDILTTKIGGDYQTISGSSVSASFVTGIVGLIKTMRPWLNADLARETILQGARRVPTLSGKVSSGGVVDASGALNALNTLPPSEGRDDSGGNNGGEHGKNGNGRGNQAGNRAGAGNNGNRDGHEFTVPPIPLTPGVPGLGLPNLDELRRRQPTSPQAPAPIHSNRRSRRNSLHPPNGRRVGDRISALDAEDFQPLQYNPQEQTPIDLLAFINDFSSLESLFGSDNSIISDSPFSLTRNARPKSLSILHPQLSSKFLLELVPLALLLLPQSSPSKIAFASNRDGTAQIYLMNSDGSDQTRLTNNSANDESPRCSPDNTRLLFQSDRDNPFSCLAEIYVMNSDGTGQTRLTTDPADDSYPVWSPDGSKSAFQSLRNGTNYQVYVMNADGSNQVNISNSSSNDGQPSWSPDGTRIAFTSDRDHMGRPSVYVMQANGSQQTRLTWSNSPFGDEHPAWSPDGTKLAFTSTRDSLIESWQETDDDGNVLERSAVRINKEVYMMNADGSNQTRLTNTLEHDDSPSWSGDGTKIVFRSERERDCCDPMQQMWVMNADGSNQVNLSNSWFGDYSPSWQRMTGNITPSVSITSPTNGATFTAPASITINANANDGDGIVSRVDFYQGATLIGTDTTSPYSVTWSNVAVGSYTLTARAIDNAGAATTSAAVQIIVNNNQLPTANTGGPYTGETTQAVQFNGGNSSDPDGTIMSYSWNFGDGTTGTGASPTHAYAIPNTYTVTLTVTDNNGGQSSVTTTASVRTTLADQYVRDFHQLALSRQPSAAEQSYWNDILRKAYANGQDSLLLASRELGRTMFDSAEYAARQRSDADFIRDLYMAYLHREPEPAGFNYWMSQLPTQGRENLRYGFAYSGEFQTVVAIVLPNGTASSTATSLLSARVDPNNRTGTGGEDLLSRNYNWSVPLLGLPGRAGMNLGLSLSYNSLVWTKSGPYIYFDEDNGPVSPGFRADFPSIQGRYFNAAIGQNAYLLMTSSGGRVELRQVGTTNVYESADSSYLQLTDNGNLILKTTDGTQLTYAWSNNEYRCTEVKDRNGNFITINRNGFGQIATIIDTLGRTITFNYDANQNLISITQPWNGQSHQWATFGYNNKTIQTGFSPKVIGIQNNAVIPMLIQVGFSDGTRYNFDYNSYGQVSVISHFAADNHQLSYTSYTLPANADDCPRVTDRRDWAEVWNGLNGVPAEVVTQYGKDTDGACRLTAPDGTVYKNYYGSGWQSGLTIQTETWSSGGRKKWTTISYTQDDTSLSYEKNPRVTETNIYDSDNNRKRTTIEYGAYAQWGLPYLVKEYAADGVTPIRHTFTDYNLTQPYLDRHIIGLVSAIHMSDGAWQVKTGFEYDAGGDQLQATVAPATQHDASYNTSLTARGNLTLVSRYDVTDIGNESKKLITRMGYDTDGSLLFTRDHLGHQSNLNYTDSFSDGVNRNTFAYPTTATDAENYSSTSQYNYDSGATTRTQSPTPAGQSQGAIQTFEYDTAGRTTRVNTINTGAYRRWVYDSYGAVISFTTVESGLPEAMTVSYFDGEGRLRATGGDSPNSAGGYWGQYTYYDRMGRATQTSNVGEMNGSWIPAGDDVGGWVWTQQQYDWQGRPTLTTLPSTDDGQSSPTKEMTYGGCGCAGGQVVTLRDEMGRRQRVTSDILGRAWKTEVLNWDQSVYSTVVNIFNSRDQVINIRQYQGTEGSGAYQESVMTYDGYGRLLTRKAPEQASPTSYTYNADDTTNTVTDARGATKTFSYNNRHLVTGISYSAPTSIPPTAPVSFTYDAAGNRTQMIDAAGSVSYSYDQLSQLVSETRQFNQVSNPLSLSYEYTLDGSLKKLTVAPSNTVVNYGLDAVGRVTSVTGQGFESSGVPVSQFATNIRYRAWGGLKHMDYGNTLSLDTNYNNRLQPSSFEISTLMKINYQYYADKKVRYSQHITDDRDDRAYSYDHMGRLVEAKSGAEARGGSQMTGPYRETFSYNPWGNLTTRETQHWWQPGEYYSFLTTYHNNRRDGWQYDADGRLTNGDDVEHQINAAGQEVLTQANSFSTGFTYDGDGQIAGKTGQWYLKSTVLGGLVVFELNGLGQHQTNVFLDGKLLASQYDYNTPDHFRGITWYHVDPSATTRGSSFLPSSQYPWRFRYELDPMGADVGVENPYDVGPPPSPPPPQQYYEMGSPEGIETCTLDGILMPCNELMRKGDAAARCPNDDCGPRVTNRGFEFFHAFADGYQGYMAMGATYLGDGRFMQPGAFDQPAGRLRRNSDGEFLQHHLGGRRRDNPQPQPAQQPQKTPCDVQVPDINAEPDQYALVNALMHETTTPDWEGRNAYQDGDSYGNPTGPIITADELLRESHLLASAIVNFSSNNNHRSIYYTVRSSGLISDENTNSEGWWRIGNDRIVAAQQENGPNCARLKRAVHAATTRDDNARLDPALYQRWLGRVQFHRRGRPTINNANGRITGANTIFRF